MRLLRIRGLVLGLATLAGCGSAGPAASPSTGAAQKTEPFWPYLPLLDDTVAAFETESVDTGERGILMMRIRRPRPGLAELDIGGRVQRLELTAEGARLAEGGWLLRGPLVAGQTYPGRNGPITILNADRSLTVPAGSYTHCLETQETSSASTVRTVFCEGVGIAEIHVEGGSAQNPSALTARLKSYGPRIDIGKSELRVLSSP